ncbi:MAG TPA: ZIP family metal transporter [Aridibacter sp.]|nr:ZIP family metal transporter [Aridibacter sp.]
MSCIAFVGSAIFRFSGETLEKILLPLVAFSAGALIGGALFHVIPASLEAGSAVSDTFLWVAAGFTVFFALEQFLHWHHCKRADTDCKRPLTYLILIGDGLHNFIGGLAIAGTFMLDVRLGIAAWFAAAAHELPQELGDMGVLLYGGWSKAKATIFNFVSALTFLFGGLIAYWLSFGYEIWFLIRSSQGIFCT